jgi:hypothetical protein
MEGRHDGNRWTDLHNPLLAASEKVGMGAPHLEKMWVCKMKGAPC